MQKQTLETPILNKDVPKFKSKCYCYCLIRDCHILLKAGYVQHTSSNNAMLNKRFAELNLTSDALNYWQDELGNRSDSTKDFYLRHFEKFLNCLRKTTDELIQQEQPRKQTNETK